MIHARQPSLKQIKHSIRLCSLLIYTSSWVCNVWMWVVLTNMCCTIPFPLPQNTHSICILWLRIAVAPTILNHDGTQQISKHQLRVSTIVEWFAYPALEFWWESGLKFDWCAIAVVSLDKHLHVRRLQCWRAWLCHLLFVLRCLSLLQNEAKANVMPQCTRTHTGRRTATQLNCKYTAGSTSFVAQLCCCSDVQTIQTPN